MDAQRWATLKDSFAELADLEPAERSHRLAVLDAQDAELSERLRRLLDADTGDDAPAAAEPAPAAADPFGLVGSTVARFRVLEVLGCGGMGVVYLAEDTRLGRTVALKFMLPQLALDADAKRRFLHEARTASALDHPNVCAVHEAGEAADGRLYLAMPYYRGETLRQRIAREGALPVDAALATARQVLAGLGAAHAAGVVHRDLKPANLLLADDGAVRILDFGLARAHDLKLTGSGVRPGTVAYMSPEQMRDAPVDARADLWSLGVVLYEMLTGRQPFGTGHDLSTVYSILHEAPVPPSRLRPALPAALDGVVLRLLRREPAERYADVAAVVAALDDAARGVAEPAPRPPARARRRHRAAAGALLGVAALALLLSVPGRWPSTPVAALVADGAAAADAAPRSVAILPFADLSADGGLAYLGDGIAEEILNALARAPELRVPARASSFSFRGRDVPAGEIARRLSVDAVLEGSVQRVGDRVRITTRLVDARADRHLWSDAFERSADDVLGVQAEIARAVAAALQVRLAGAVAAPEPARGAAHELYLRGLFHWNRRSANDVQLAIRHFEEAALADPTYARPHAGLALAYAVVPISFSPALPADAALARLEQAAARALALDASLAEPHAARGYAYHWHWRWEDAERELRRAVELNPEYPTARQWYGELLMKTGRIAEGEAQMRRALMLDPLSLVANNDLGILLLVDRRYAEARAQLEHTLALDPGFAIPHYVLHRLHMMTGDVEEAARAGRRWAELSRAADPDELVALARATRDPALRPRALAILGRWERRDGVAWTDVAAYHALLGERERALAALENAMRLRQPQTSQLLLAPWFDSVRDDPRAQRIIRQIRAR